MPERSIKALNINYTYLLIFPYKLQTLVKILSEIKYNLNRLTDKLEIISPIPVFKKRLNSERNLKRRSNTDSIRVVTNFFEMYRMTYISVVDDIAQIRKIYLNYIKSMQRADIITIECKDGREAVNSYSLYHDQIICIIMDFQMPVMDGTQASKEIRKIENEKKYKPSFILGISGDEIPCPPSFDKVCMMFT